MEIDPNDLIFAVVVSLITAGIIELIRRYKTFSLKQDIETLELEKNILEEMKKSSVEMNRVSFRGIFMCFFLIALANLHLSLSTILDVGVFSMRSGGQIILWFLVLLVAFHWWRRYHNLKNYKVAIGKLEQRILEKRGKLDK